MLLYAATKNKGKLREFLDASAQSAVPDLRMSDMRQGFTEQGSLPNEGRAGLEGAISGQRADEYAAAVAAANACQIGEGIDVDQNFRPRQTKIHCWHQALPASKKFGVLAVLGLYRQRMFK